MRALIGQKPIYTTLNHIRFVKFYQSIKHRKSVFFLFCACKIYIDIKKVMKERDYHKKHAVKYDSHNHWILYQSARNKVNSMMRKAKSDYFRRKIDAS